MKLKHYDNLGDTRFVTFCCHKRLPLLVSPQTVEPVLREIESARIEYKFKLLAYVIMPEHVHLVLYPEHDLALGRMIGAIKSRSAKVALRALKETGAPVVDSLRIFRNREEKFAFWQRRCYDHNCRSVESVWKCVNYCHENPVKRGLVKNIEDWNWSSAKAYTGGDTPIEVDRM